MSASNVNEKEFDIFPERLIRPRAPKLHRRQDIDVDLYVSDFDISYNLTPELLRVNTRKNLRTLANLHVHLARLVSTSRDIGNVTELVNYDQDIEDSSSEQTHSEEASSINEYASHAGEGEISADIGTIDVEGLQLDDEGEQHVVRLFSTPPPLEQEHLVLPKTLTRSQNQETLLKYVASPHIAPARQLAPPSRIPPASLPTAAVATRASDGLVVPPPPRTADRLMVTPPPLPHNQAPTTTTSATTTNTAPITPPPPPTLDGQPGSSINHILAEASAVTTVADEIRAVESIIAEALIQETTSGSLVHPHRVRKMKTSSSSHAFHPEFFHGTTQEDPQMWLRSVKHWVAFHTHKGLLRKGKHGRGRR